MADTEITPITDKPSTDEAALTIFETLQRNGFSPDEMQVIITELRGLVRGEYDKALQAEEVKYEERKRLLLSKKNAV